MDERRVALSLSLRVGSLHVKILKRSADFSPQVTAQGQALGRTNFNPKENASLCGPNNAGAREFCGNASLLPTRCISHEAGNGSESKSKFSILSKFLCKNPFKLSAEVLGLGPIFSIQLEFRISVGLEWEKAAEASLT